MNDLNSSFTGEGFPIIPPQRKKQALPAGPNVKWLEKRVPGPSTDTVITDLDVSLISNSFLHSRTH